VGGLARAFAIFVSFCLKIFSFFLKRSRFFSFVGSDEHK
jgi:hypothetical protein